jgi:16S rRNA pseudouridine516 synthase
MNQAIGMLTSVVVDGEVQQHYNPVYIMLNKPKGVVSPTKDDKHTTVVDILDYPKKYELHIAGRFDFNTTGLLLLTNDGAWSKKLSLPENSINKIYRVNLKEPLTPDIIIKYQQAFTAGIHLLPENITTQPATVIMLDDHTVELTICEGRYHQVKRMFGFFQNEVLDLHRLSVANIVLDDALAPGESRVLLEEEIRFVCL